MDEITKYVLDSQTVCSDRNCNRKTFDGSKCILHSEAADKIGFEDAINELIDEWVDDCYDFFGVIFPRNFPIHFFEGKDLTCANFAHSKFLGEISFHKTRFGENTSFYGAEFCEEANFSFSHFASACISFDDEDSRHLYFSKKRSSFAKAKFQGEVNFSKAHFEGEANFYKAIFKKGSYFYLTDFHDESFFYKAEFHGWAYFSETKFRGPASFYLATFFSGVYFLFAQFFKEVTFSHCNFLNNKVLFEGMQGAAVFNSQVNFQLVSKNAEIFFRATNLQQAKFLHTDVTDINFENVVWAKKDNRIQIFEDKKSAWKHSEEMKASLEILYRQLKYSCEKRADYETSGDFHIGEMEMKRMQRRLGSPDRWLLTCYKWLSFYGERWLRPLFILIMSLPLFAFLLSIAGARVDGRAIDLSWGYSARTMLYGLQVATLQRPTEFELITNWSRLTVAFWTMLGPSLLALALLAIRRRFKR